MSIVDCEDIQSDLPVVNSVNRKKRVSIVWRYFEKLDRLRVRCRLCRHVQNYQGTTGNILRHLKNKHNIDATIKGQQENPGLAEKLANEVVENCRSTDEDYFNNVMIKANISEVSSTRQLPKRKSKNAAFSNELLDPYTDSSFHLYHDTDVPADRNITQISSDKQKYSPEEERILAEIEYFREKAGYYRMQKNLIALQAKKIKFQLERL